MQRVTDLGGYKKRLARVYKYVQHPHVYTDEAAIVIHIDFLHWFRFSDITTMRLHEWFLPAILLSFPCAFAQVNGCPTTDLACHDIMNSSQCIEQQILEGNGTTRAGMIKCVEYEGTASSLPGAVKVRRRGTGSDHK